MTIEIICVFIKACNNYCAVVPRPPLPPATTKNQRKLFLPTARKVTQKGNRKFLRLKNRLMFAEIYLGRIAQVCFSNSSFELYLH